MASTTQGTMNDPKGGVAKVTCPTFEAMGQIPVFHRTYFLIVIFICFYFAFCQSSFKRIYDIV